MAKKMFDDAEPMNKEVKIDNDLFRVTGILKDLPINTEFDFEYLLPWAYMKKIGADDDSWGNNSIMTFVQLKTDVSIHNVSENIKDITKRHSDGKEDHEVFLHPLSQWHLYSDFENGKV